MMNQKPKPWHLSLSAFHVVILLGLVTGSMAGAFYLGFSSGQHVGYESALRATSTSMARLPVPTEELDKSAADQLTSEVYAKLTGEGDKEEPIGKKSPESPSHKDADIPEVGAIVTTDTAPIIPEDLAAVDSLLPGADMEGAGTTGAGIPGSLPSKAAAASDSAKVLKQAETLGATLEGADTHNAQAGEVVRKGIEILEQPAADESVVKEGTTAGTQKTASTPPLAIAAKAVAPETANTVINNAAVNTGAESAREKPSAPAVKEPAVKDDGSVPVKSTIPAGWYVQVAAPRSLEEANKLATALRRASIPVMIEAAQVRGEDYYRVVAGPRKQRAGAEQLMGQIKSKKSLPGEPFVRAVK